MENDVHPESASALDTNNKLSDNKINDVIEEINIIDKNEDYTIDDKGNEEGEDKKRRSLVQIILKRPLLIIFILLIFAFLFHPRLLNIHLYFKSKSDPIPMNFVSNFYLWTRQNVEDPERLVAGAIDEISNSKLRSQKTYFIIHGFTRNGLDKWVIRLKNALLWRENCNVISVDWESGSVTAGYYVIQARVPLVGEDLSKFIKFLLQQTTLNLSDMHLIGHSLGAHIAGYAGRYLNGSLERITGLDPASLGYNGSPANSRLDKSDALFVDVIHTHGCYTIVNQWVDCFGTYDNIGDADFWPNGGEKQPPCEEDGDGVNFVPETSNCDHGMAYVYYTESIKHFATSTRFIARKCESLEQFNNGTCACEYPPQYMGFNVNPSISGVFYLNTTKMAPYGILEPNCSPAHYSLLRILGITSCALLITAAIIKSSLTIAILCGHADKVDNIKMKFLKLANKTVDYGKDRRE